MLGDEFGVDIIVVVYKNATKNLRPNNSTFKAGLALYFFYSKYVGEKVKQL